MPKRSKAVYDGVTVVLPAGARALSSGHKAKLDEQFTQGEWNTLKGKKKGCRVVFFTASRVGARCKGRSLSTAAKSRYKAMDVCVARKKRKVCFKKGGRKICKTSSKPLPVFVKKGAGRCAKKLSK